MMGGLEWRGVGWNEVDWNLAESAGCRYVEYGGVRGQAWNACVVVAAAGLSE